MAYHCCHIAKSTLATVANFHPLAALQAFLSIEQPDGYPDAMPLHVALAQPDQEHSSG